MSDGWIDPIDDAKYRVETETERLERNKLLLELASIANRFKDASYSVQYAATEMSLGQSERAHNQIEDAYATALAAIRRLAHIITPDH